MQGVRGGEGEEIFGGSQDDTAWANNRGKTNLVNLSHLGRVTDVLHGLTDQEMPADLPGGGMHRPSDDEDGDAGSFTAPSCPGHRGHFGGGKPPPPTVTLMPHSVPPTYTEWKAPWYRTVRQGSEAKEATASGGGTEGDHGEGL